MRIDGIDIPSVEPTQTGMYLLRSKDGKFTGIGLLTGDGLRLQNGQGVPSDDFYCYGPLRFTELPEKIHTTYKVDFVTPTPGATGGFSVLG